MIITAKFAGICPCCNGRINAGDKVEWSKGSKARHVGCAQQPGAVSAPSAKPAGRTATERTYMRRYGWDGRRGSSSYYTSGMYDEES